MASKGKERENFFKINDNFCDLGQGEGNCTQWCPFLK
jgi:hypothetical protein